MHDLRLLPLCLLLLTCLTLLAPTPGVAQLAEAPAPAAAADLASIKDAGPLPGPRPDAPEMTLDLTSPRATLLNTYFPAVNRISRHEGDADEAWQHVLATMQWQGVMDEAEAREAAMQLLEVLDRLGLADADDLPGRADLGNASLNRFVYFPQPELHAWVWEALEPFGRWPQGQVVFVRTEHGWQFSAATLQNIDALAESLAPLQPRHLAPQIHVTDPTAQLIGMLGPTVERTPWWGWLALASVVFLGLLAGKLLGKVLRRIGDSLHRRGWEMRAVAFDDAANPGSLACLTLALTIGMQAFVAIEPESPLEELVSSILTFLYLVALGWFLFNLVDIIDLSLRRVTERAEGKMDDMVIGLIRKALRIVLVIMFTLVVADNVFGLNIAAWLAGFGIAGLAVSLAAQDSIRNMFGSLTVFFDKPFKVGDMITFDGQTGTVTEIGFRSTKQRLFSGAVITIPNMKFIDGSVENISRRTNIRRVMNISITYDTPPAKVEEAVQILKEILQSEAVAAPFDMEETPPRVVFSEYQADNLNLMAIYWYMLDADKGQDWWGYNYHAEQVNLLVFRRFLEAGIDFAFPTQTLYLAGDKDRELGVRMLNGAPSPDGASEPSPARDR